MRRSNDVVFSHRDSLRCDITLLKGKKWKSDSVPYRPWQHNQTRNTMTPDSHTMSPITVFHYAFFVAILCKKGIIYL